MRRTLQATILAGAAALLLAAAGAAEACKINKLPVNPDAPERGAGRLGSGEFFKRFAGAPLELVETNLVPNGDFGIARPGESFANSWLVAAQGAKLGLNHKSAPWAQAVLVCKAPDGTETLLKPDRGCGCGGAADWGWTIPDSAPPGRHTVRVTWEWPKQTAQKLERTYTITIENPRYGKTRDAEIAKLESQHPGKLVVLQDGLPLDGRPYDGAADLALACGGYEGDHTAMIYPRARTLDLGYWIANTKASHYDRGLLKFDLAPLLGKRVKQAILKLTVRQGQKYLAGELAAPLPVYPMLKPWAEGDGVLQVDERGLAKGHPNVYYQAYPVKWEQELASGASDHGPQRATLEPEKGVNPCPGARADVTELVQDWLSGKLPNHGLLIGPDLPAELAGVHPGTDGQVEAFKKLWPHGLVPFFSSDEPSDLDYRPRLLVVLE
ncbi:MAG: hypothetical protein M5U26_18930 [Planctomycetota bacterium]|nr:hypothetical protein [Planctomycetota bacterium]